MQPDAAGRNLVPLFYRSEVVTAAPISEAAASTPAWPRCAVSRFFRVIDTMGARAPDPTLQRAGDAHPSDGLRTQSGCARRAFAASMSRRALPLRSLGSTGLTVSRIGLGLAALGRPAYINLGRERDFGSGRAVSDLER